jgi:hypothetical protein
MRPLHFFYVGNFAPPHSTENHIREALEHNGHRVTRLMERPENWPTAADAFWIAEGEQKVDVVLWTSTSGYAPPETYQDQHNLLTAASNSGVPTVGYHLDLWWTLKREHEIREKPFFRCDLLCTADGGHQEQWFNAGKRHYWFPPAIVESECRLGTPRDEYVADVAFVGSWRGYGHPESTHRFELVRHLAERWDAKFWPPKGADRIDGAPLRDLYASTKVVVGDSAMVPRLQRYWSDRIPNTTGRGAYLLHPWVEGIDMQHPYLDTWNAGEWGELDYLIDKALRHQGAAMESARENYAHTLEYHTYEVRMKALVELLTMKGML